MVTLYESVGEWDLYCKAVWVVNNTRKALCKYSRFAIYWLSCKDRQPVGFVWLDTLINLNIMLCHWDVTKTHTLHDNLCQNIKQILKICCFYSLDVKNDI